MITTPPTSMLTEFGIGNFQAFKTLQRVPLKPITLVFGPNSAGKSALLRSLLVVRHALLNGKLSKSGGDEDRHPGAFRDFARKGGEGSVNFEFLTNPSTPTGKTTENVRLKVGWTEKDDGRLETSSLDLARSGEGIATYIQHWKAKHLKIDSLGAPPRIHALDAFKLGMETWLREEGKTPETWLRQEGETPETAAEKFQDVVNMVGSEVQERQSSLNMRLSLQKGAMLPGASLDDFRFEDPEDEDDPDSLLEELGQARGDIRDMTQHVNSDVTPSARAKWFRAALNAMRTDIHTAVNEVETSLSDCLLKIDYHGPQRPVPDGVTQEDKEKPGLKSWWQLAADPTTLKKLNDWLQSDAFPKKHRLEFDRLFVASNYETLVASLKGELTMGPIIEAAFEAKFENNRAFQDELIEDAVSGFGLWDDAHPEESEYDTRAHAEGAAWDIVLNEADSHGWRVYNQLIEDGDWEGTIEFLLLGVNHLRHKYADTLSAPWEKFEKAEIRFVDQVTGARIRPSNLGFGFSQMVPLAASAFALENRLIVIEQPELHVHPALQTELADLFIDSAMNRNNRYLIETHSEHVILRVMRRIRQTVEGNLPEGKPPIAANDVCILYVEPSENGSIVREMPLNERGELVKGWPGGFFEEAFNEMFS